MLAISYAQVGRVEEAQAMLDKGFEGWPPAIKNVRFFMATNFAHKDSQVTQRFAEALVKAGLPGEPSGFYKISEENRMAGEALKEKFFGRKVNGFTPGSGKQWLVERSRDGKATFRDGDIIDSGKSWIEEDMLCDQWDNFYEGLKDCWVVYRNPEGTPENDDEYLGAPGYGIYPFALAQ